MWTSSKLRRFANAHQNGRHFNPRYVSGQANLVLWKPSIAVNMARTALPGRTADTGVGREPCRSARPLSPWISVKTLRKIAFYKILEQQVQLYLWKIAWVSAILTEKVGRVNCLLTMSHLPGHSLLCSTRNICLSGFGHRKVSNFPHDSSNLIAAS